MRSLSRVLSLFLVVGVLIAFGAFVAPRVSQRIAKLEEYFPGILAMELSKFLGRDVSIGAIHWKGEYRRRHVIELDHLRLNRKSTEIGPATASIDRVVVHYNPSLLSLHLFKPLDAINSIDVYHPVVFVLHNRLGKWNVLQILKPGPPNRKSRIPLTTTVHLYNGDVSYLDLKTPHGPPEGVSAHLVALNGTALLQEDGPVRFDLAGAGAPAQDAAGNLSPPMLVKMNAAGLFNVGSTGMELRTTLDRFAIARLMNAYFSLKFATILAGSASGGVTIQKPDLPSGHKAPFAYSIVARFDGLTGAVSRLPGLVTNASGRFSLADETLGFRIDHAAYGSARLSGQGTMVGFHNPLLKGSFAASGLTTRMLSNFLKPSLLNRIQIPGAFGASLRLQGPAGRPVVAGTLHVPTAVFQGTRITDAAIGFHYSGQQLDLEGGSVRIAGGIASVTGVVNIQGGASAYHLEGYAQNVNPAGLPLPPSLRKLHLTGRVSADFDLIGAGAAFGGTARFAAAAPTIMLGGTHAAARLLTGTVDLSSSPDAGVVAGAQIAMNSLALAVRNRTYTAAKASAVVNLALEPHGRSSVTTQGALQDLRGDGIEMPSAAWRIGPGPAGLETVDLLAAGPRGDIHVSGTTTPSFSNVDLTLLARNVNLGALAGLSPALAEVQGTGYLTGTLTGSLQQPNFQGLVQILNASYAGYSFSRLHGGLALTSSGLAFRNFVLHLGPGEIALNGEIGLKQFHPTTFNLTADAKSISLGQLASLLRVRTPVTGSGQAHIVIAGTVNHPVMDGSVQLATATVQQYPIVTAALAFHYAPDVALFRATHRTADLVAGLELRRLQVVSPTATINAFGAPIGPDHRLAIHTDITNISLADVKLPPQIAPLQNVSISADVHGTVEHPEIIARLAPTFVEVEAQRFQLTAENILIRPRLNLGGGPAAVGRYPVDLVSIGNLELSRGAEVIRLSGELLPDMNAAVVATGFQFSTLAALAGKPLPNGLSGTLARASLSANGPVLAVLEEKAPPGTSVAARVMERLTGRISITLRDLAMAPPSPTLNPVQAAAQAESQPVPGQNGAPAAAPGPAAGQAATEGPARGALQPAAYTAAQNASRAASSTPSSSTGASGTTTRSLVSGPGPSSSTGAVPVAPGPAPGMTAGTVHFDIGQFDAHFTGRRIDIDDLYLYQYAAPDPRSPGLHFQVLQPPTGPAPYVEIDGNMQLAAEAPGIPVSLAAPWIPQVNRVSGDLILALLATGPVHAPRVEISVNAPAPPEPPLAPTPVAGKRGRRTRRAARSPAGTSAPAPVPAAVSSTGGTAPAAPAGPQPLVVEGITLTRASLVAIITEGSIRLDHLIIAVGTHQVSASGSLPFTWHPAPGRRYIPSDAPVRFQGGLVNDDLSVLHDLSPTMVPSASGPFSASLVVGGTLAAPDIRGDIIAGTAASPGVINLAHVDQGIRNLVVHITFNRSRMNVDQFTGGTDRGTFAVTGYVDLPTAVPGTGAIHMGLTTTGLHLTDHGLVGAMLARSQSLPAAAQHAAYETVVGYLETHLSIIGPLMRPLLAGQILLHDTEIRAAMLPLPSGGQPVVHRFDPAFNLRMDLGRKVSLGFLSVLRVNPTGYVTLTGDLNAPVIDGRLDTARGGGYINYFVGFWQIESSTTYVHYDSATGPGLYLHAVLTTQVADTSTSSSPAGFFAPAGQMLNVRMEVDGRALTPGGLHIIDLTSDPPRSRAELEQMLLHTQALQGLAAGSTQTVLPGLFNEIVRQSITGTFLAPYEMQIAQALGLEELNVEYDFSGPLYLEVSRRLIGGLSARMKRSLSASSNEYQFYLDYHVRNALTFSFGILQRPTYQEQSFTIQTFFRF